jgi:hypothetical protein
VTHDGSQAQANRLKCYVNGVNRSVASISTGTVGNLTSNVQLFIGSDEANNNMVGRLDSVRYRVGYVASAREIQEKNNEIKGAYGVMVV